jgi:hypothetical protein
VLVATPDFSKHYRRFYEDRTHVHPYAPTSLRDAVEQSGLEVVQLSALNVRRLLGRLPWLWRRVPRLLFTGNAILCVGRKH